MGTVTKSIGTSARDYSTITLWEASLPANLVTDGNSYVGQCYNDSEFLVTSGITINGHTTDSTHFITLTTGPGQGFRNHASKLTNALTYDVSKGVGIRTSTHGTFDLIQAVNDYTLLDGLQIACTDNYNAVAVNFYGAGPSSITNCLIDWAGGNSGRPLRMSGGNLTRYGIALNCVFIHRGDPAVAAIANSEVGPDIIANCTIVRPSDLGPGGSGAFSATPIYANNVHHLINCAVFGFAEVVNAAGFVTYSTTLSGNNASDLTGALIPGVSNQASKAYASQFVGTTVATMDWRAKSGANLIDTGQTDTTDIPSAIDIVGTARPQGSAWDIGAWEFTPTTVLYELINVM